MRITSGSVAGDVGTPAYEPVNTQLSHHHFDNPSDEQAYKCFACRVRKA